MRGDAAVRLKPTVAIFAPSCRFSGPEKRRFVEARLNLTTGATVGGDPCGACTSHNLTFWIDRSAVVFPSN